MSEETIIEHCSPTLAGIKTGNLFSVKVTNASELKNEIRAYNDSLRDKGLRVIPLRVTRKYALIYLYRPSRLIKDLNDPQASHILKRMGYSFKNPEMCIVELVRRLEHEESFPHEIGLFLGYPPSDVECFMKHPCSGVKCRGCWKAYSEPEKAAKLFERFRMCTEAYHKMHRKGKSLAQLAVTTA
ncbi:MAG: DUF3793 family protein [Lachnospiraceae bacterium]|nr:DUF3793 family protein [Lachnospiraceae bacterium]